MDAVFGLRSVYQNRHGFTLLEIIIITAALGLLSGIVFQTANQGRRGLEARNFSNQIRATLQLARFEAIRRNQSVAYVYDAPNEQFLTLTTSSSTPSNGDCSLASPNVIHRLSDSTSPNFAVDSNLPGNGVIWNPQGLAYNCDGLFLGNDLGYDINDSGTLIAGSRYRWCRDYCNLCRHGKFASSVPPFPFSRSFAFPFAFPVPVPLTFPFSCSFAFPFTFSIPLTFPFFLLQSLLNTFSNS